MFLYKYIGFHNAHWSEPHLTRELYFSSVDQLRGPNDPEEFNVTWDSQGEVAHRFEEAMSDRLEKLYSSTRVLCLGLRLTKQCWDAFCSPAGGVCYEFRFDPERVKSEISKGTVTYDYYKDKNFPKFLEKKVTSSKIRALFRKGELSYEERVLFWEYVQQDEPNLIARKFVSQEIALKKLKKFSYEQEYRFLHLDESGPLLVKELETKLRNSKLSFDDLGLELNKIYTSDSEKLRGLSLSPKPVLKKGWQAGLFCAEFSQDRT